MKNTQFFAYGLLASLCTLQVIADTSTQTIDVTNNTHQAMHYTANNPAQALRVDHSVPAYARSVIISVVTKLPSPQDMLYTAIINDSVTDIVNAVSAGANVNQNIDGKSPLAISALYKRYNAINCLLGLGAR